MSKISALNVAEKPSVAKSVSQILSRGSSVNKRIGRSKYNPIWEFTYDINGQSHLMSFTSVCGHIKGVEYPPECKDWRKTPFEKLYSTALIKEISEKCKYMVKNITDLAKKCEVIILWLDCDREGEAIAFDVLDEARKSKRNIRVKRAHFSALTFPAITEAIQNLGEPNIHLANAVRMRQEIDLRIGASFTRFQTLTIRDALPHCDSIGVLSYGPCQFPTLGFIVERHKEIMNFRSETFFKLDCKYEEHEEPSGGKVKSISFDWDRGRCFEELISIVIYEMCLEVGQAIVTKVQHNIRTRNRPTPLNTIEFSKIATRKLKITSHKALEIAEKLYQKGFISYPRTETNKYDKTIDLKELISRQASHLLWGDYVQEMTDGNMYGGPLNGKEEDGAHPPIHTVKLANQNDLPAEEWRVYELITRHFLASLSRNAIGKETKIFIEIGEESFTGKGLRIVEYNWLRIYKYEKWVENEIPDLSLHQIFVPSELMLNEGGTQPPGYLTEADLIDKMAKNGIGTDATINEHIKTVQDRKYAKKEGTVFKPEDIGIALVSSYEKLKIPLNKPNLRAQMEKDMQLVATGAKDNESMLAECLHTMQEIFNRVTSLKPHFVSAFQEHITHHSLLPHSTNGGHHGGNNTREESKEANNNSPSNNPNHHNGLNGSDPEGANALFMLCSLCKVHQLRLMKSRIGNFFIGCVGYPQCQNTISIPDFVTNASVSEELCGECSDFEEGVLVSKIELTFLLPAEASAELFYLTSSCSLFCFGGCDYDLRRIKTLTLDLKRERVNGGMEEGGNKRTFHTMRDQYRQHEPAEIGRGTAGKKGKGKGKGRVNKKGKLGRSRKKAKK